MAPEGLGPTPPEGTTEPVAAGAVQAGVVAPMGPPGITVDWTASEVSVSQGVEEAAGAVQAGVVAPWEGATGDSPVGLAGTETVSEAELPGTPGMTVD
jgi:hypothetical protein